MIKWISVADQFPPEGERVLLQFTKQAPTRKGVQGTFLVEGFTSTRNSYEGWELQKGRVTLWNDYTGRLLCIHGGASKNRVTHWAELPNTANCREYVIEQDRVNREE